MLRFFCQLLPLLAPVGIFAWWVQGPVQHYLYHGFVTRGILLLLAGLAVLALVDGLLLKLWLLPLWAHSLSVRFSSGSYLPENDPLVRLVQRVSIEPNRERLSELTHLVESDPRRVRGWMELARVHSETFHDPSEAVATLLRGAQAVHNAEDSALLMWRAASLCEQHSELTLRAQPIFSDIARLFPSTGYGRLAATRIPQIDNHGEGRSRMTNDK